MHQSNVEKITYLMEFSRTGPVMQIFIIDSVSKIAAAVLKKPEAELERAFETSGVSAVAWRKAAEEFLTKFELPIPQPVERVEGKHPALAAPYGQEKPETEDLVRVRQVLAYFHKLKLEGDQSYVGSSFALDVGKAMFTVRDLIASERSESAQQDPVNGVSATQPEFVACVSSTLLQRVEKLLASFTCNEADPELESVLADLRKELGHG